MPVETSTAQVLADHRAADMQAVAVAIGHVAQQDAIEGVAQAVLVEATQADGGGPFVGAGGIGRFRKCTPGLVASSFSGWHPAAAPSCPRRSRAAPGALHRGRSETESRVVADCASVAGAVSAAASDGSEAQTSRASRLRRSGAWDGMGADSLGTLDAEGGGVEGQQRRNRRSVALHVIYTPHTDVRRFRMDLPAVGWLPEASGRRATAIQRDEPTESWARLSKRVYSPKNFSLHDPVGRPRSCR